MGLRPGLDAVQKRLMSCTLVFQPVAKSYRLSYTGSKGGRKRNKRKGKEVQEINKCKFDLIQVFILKQNSSIRVTVTKGQTGFVQPSRSTGLPGFCFQGPCLSVTPNWHAQIHYKFARVNIKWTFWECPCCYDVINLYCRGREVSHIPGDIFKLFWSLPMCNRSRDSSVGIIIIFLLLFYLTAIGL
jgi:hypothetical protein